MIKLKMHVTSITKTKDGFKAELSTMMPYTSTYFILRESDDINLRDLEIGQELFVSILTEAESDSEISKAIAERIQAEEK